MQKLIAILFFLLLGSVTLLPGIYLQTDAVEQLADNDKGKEAQPEKKEVKEYLSHCIKRITTVALARTFHASDIDHWLPKPLLPKSTPPPNVIC